MYKKRELIKGLFHHVTSRTNNKMRVFENNLGRKIMLMTLQDAKDKYRFRLANFCVMPTHIHLLIRPAEETCLSRIMYWIKLQSAKRWNSIHGSIDHMWGKRFFAKAVKHPQEFDFVMNYIDQNPVAAGLSSTPEEWKASGAYYRKRNIPGLVDLPQDDRQPQIKLLSPVPHIVSRLLPLAQLERTLRHFGAYAEAVDRLYKLIPTIPRLGESVYFQKPPICLRYFTNTADYFIYEYDGEDTMYGMERFNVYPYQTRYRKFSLSNLKSSQFMQLDFSWFV